MSSTTDAASIHNHRQDGHDAIARLQGRDGRPRVAFLIGGREGGGMSVAALDLIRRVRRDRFEISVLSTGQGNFSNRIRAEGFDCQEIGTGWPPMMRRSVGDAVEFERGSALRMLAWTIRTARALGAIVRAENIDIVHTNYHHFHLVAALAASGTNTKVVWHWRGRVDHPLRLADETSVRIPPLASIAPRWLWIQRLGPLLQAVTQDYVHSIAVSETVRASVRPIVGERVDVIHDGIPLDSLSTGTAGFRRLLGRPPEALLVGLVATFNPVKGHKHFIEAAAEICRKREDVHFVHIGGQMRSGQEQYRESMLRLAAELGLNGRMHFLGHREDAVALTADLDIAVSCTLPPGEGFGLTTLEAMAAAVPVVATHCGASVEIVVDGVTGLLVPPADSKALAGAWETLLSDAALRKEFGTNGRARCQREFAIESTLRRVENLYDRLLDRAPALEIIRNR